MSEAERGIFEATEALLGEVSFRELSASQIIKQAGISRATFYFYFSSKDAVLTGLLAKVMDEIFEAVRPYVERDEARDPRAAMWESLSRGAELWRRHRAVIRAVSEHWTTVPELRGLWVGVVERFTTAIAAEIDRERAAGNAPAGLDSRRLAAVLLWGSERCFHVSGLGVDQDLPDEHAAAEALFTLWVGGIYQAAPPAVAA
jgi:AcrR family transcriptional regulator